MKTIREYLRHAEECDALAQKAMSAEQRKMIADMSSTWRMLAEQRRERLARAQSGARSILSSPTATAATDAPAADADADLPVPPTVR